MTSSHGDGSAVRTGWERTVSPRHGSPERRVIAPNPPVVPSKFHPARPAHGYGRGYRRQEHRRCDYAARPSGASSAKSPAGRPRATASPGEASGDTSSGGGRSPPTPTTPVSRAG